MQEPGVTIFVFAFLSSLLFFFFRCNVSARGSITKEPLHNQSMKVFFEKKQRVLSLVVDVFLAVFSHLFLASHRLDSSSAVDRTCPRPRLFHRNCCCVDH